MFSSRLLNSTISMVLTSTGNTPTIPTESPVIQSKSSSLNVVAILPHTLSHSPSHSPQIRNAHDTANYLQFVQLLRKKLESKFKAHKLITAAVATAPFNDASGNPSKKLPGWAAALDYFYIMVSDEPSAYNSVSISVPIIYIHQYRLTISLATGNCYSNCPRTNIL